MDVFIKNPKQYVFKSAQNHIVTLQIAKGSLTNLDRKVTNILYAKYRCKSALVIRIEDSKGNRVHKINSDHDAKFIYKVGSTVTVSNYDEDINAVCAPGIHFFLSRERAFFYGELPANYTGPYNRWHDDGLLIMKSACINGELNGECKYWYDDGRIAIHQFFVNGKLNGEHKTWHSSGIPDAHEYYVDGVFQRRM